MNNLSALVLRLREHRRRRGWTQPQLAKASGIHVKTISTYENGSRSIKVYQLLAIIDAYNMTVAEFFAGPLGTECFPVPPVLTPKEYAARTPEEHRAITARIEGYESPYATRGEFTAAPRVADLCSCCERGCSHREKCPRVVAPEPADHPCLCPGLRALIAAQQAAERLAEATR